MHGGDIYTDGILNGIKFIDFSSNINPLGVPECFKENIKEAVDLAEVYPDFRYRRLKTYIKGYLNSYECLFSGKNNYCSISENICDIKEEDIVLGNGAAEIIDLVISSFKKLCIVVPSFIEYELSAEKANSYILYSHLNENMELNYEDIYSKLNEVDALVIANPNNPNGNIVNKEKFKAILDYCENKGKTVIIDEAFIEFTGDKNNSFIYELNRYKCLFIIRALTKFYALPGVRLGYGVSKNTELISYINNKQLPWNINCFAEVAAKYVLKDKTYIANSLQWIGVERPYIMENLSNLDIMEKVFSTNSNFILCKLKGIDGDELHKSMKKKGILIRNCENFKGLNKQYIRLAIKDRDKNNILIRSLENIF